ncbi:MAG: hypothetical protein Tsb002_20830 [Wenzhouxiangellaceae bacterium]
MSFTKHKPSVKKQTTDFDDGQDDARETEYSLEPNCVSHKPVDSENIKESRHPLF